MPIIGGSIVAVSDSLIDCPDLKGIKTRSSTRAMLLPVRLIDCPDIKGIKTPLICRGAPVSGSDRLP